MLPVPDVTGADIAFGSIKHMPRFGTIPEEFQRHHGNVYCKAVSSWFYSGAKAVNNVLTVDGVEFRPKAGVNFGKALGAIRAVLGSFEPKHEHKEAACAYMLSEWFEPSEPLKKRA